MSTLVPDAALALPAAATDATAPAPTGARVVSDAETKAHEDTESTTAATAREAETRGAATVSSSSTTARRRGTPTAAPALPPEVTAALERGATQLAGALGSGLRAASRSIEASSPGALEALLEDAPPLDVTTTDPLAALAARLAAESDFGQRLALRSLQRAVGADRASYAVVAAALSGALGLGVVAAIGALFPGAHPATRAALLLVGGAALLVAALVGYVFTDTVRRAQQENARRAQENAARAERRLQRLAIALALRAVDPDAHRDALVKWLDADDATTR